MSNILEFYVQMKDMMSSGLVKMANTAKQSFGSATKSSKEFATSLDGLKARLKDVEFSRAGTRLKDEFKQLTQEAKSLKREISQMDGKGGGLFSSGIGGTLKGLAIAAGLTFGASQAFGFVKSSIEAANQFGAQRQSYQVLTGNNGIGGQLADDLRGLKENTIMGPAVYKNAQTMLGFGVKAADITKDLRMLGDVSMGDANRLQHLTLAFSEVTATGRITGKEVRQFINAGFNPLMQISEMTGKSMAQVREEMKKGAISATMVQKAFEAATGPGGRFHDMLGKMAETSAGKTQMLEGRIASLKIALGERMQMGYMSVVGLMIDLVTWTKHFVEIPLEKKLGDQILKIRALQAELTSSNTSHDRQLQLFRELEQINPNIVKGIDEQHIAYGKLATNIDNVTTALKNKIFIESFDKTNAGVLSQYANAKKLEADSFGNIWNYIGQIPEIAQDTSMSPGQKQIAAIRYLQDKVKSGQVQSYYKNSTNSTTGATVGIKGSLEEDLLYDIQNAIKLQNKAVDQINALSPTIKSINKTKEVLGNQINQYMGIDSMTAAQKKGSGLSNADDGGVVGGITSGGPRIININGVKFIEKLEIHSASATEGFKEMEPKLEEMLLRLLYSGAKMQN